MTMQAQASRTLKSEGDLRDEKELGPALGVVNGCAIGLAFWAGLLWAVFG